MRITRVSVGKHVTLNLGDFNNVKPHIEVEATLDDGDDYEEVREYLNRLVDEHLDEELRKHLDE